MSNYNMMNILLLSLLLLYGADIAVASQNFSYFYLCNNIADPNLCFEREEGGFRMSRWCYNNCCTIHNNECDSVWAITTGNAIHSVHTADVNAKYHTEQCIYETADSLYELYKLQLNPYTRHSYYFQYKSVAHNSVFSHQRISLYINICNKSSVVKTRWNKPPNTASLDEFLITSSVICSQYESGGNVTAVCTQLGHIVYNTSDVTQNANMNGLTLNLGQTQCIYLGALDVASVRDIYVHLVIECDPNAHETQIISVTGPLFTLDELAANDECSKNVTITMKANTGSCARRKVFASKSHMNCPTTFNQSTKVINCTLWAMSNQSILAGNMTEIQDDYLSIHAEFVTKTQNISFDPVDIHVQYNATGIFNITLNMAAIYNKKLKYIHPRLWRSISMYGASHYPVGPNTTTANVSIRFKHSDSRLSSSPGAVFGWIVLFVFIFAMIYLGYRLRDQETRHFCWVYCIKCNCLRHGCNACMIGSYVLCCDNPKTKQGRHRSGSFWGFMKTDLDDQSQVSDGSGYDSMSDFLYREKSGYAAYFGLKAQTNNSKPQKNTSISLTSDDYVL